MSSPPGSDVRLVTVGHGTLDRAAFLELLHGAGIEAVVDVRRFPGSRRHPHFGRAAMESWLSEAGIAYRHEEDLGGRRSVAPASRNDGLRNAAFRGYADHMATPAFAAALDRLVGLAGRTTTAMLCAESVWWRCHRRLVADAAVLTRSVVVEHLFHDGRLAAHELTDAARAEGGLVLYSDPGPATLPGL